MGKCGCGDQCTCRVVEGLGTDIPGTGNSDNPYIVNVNGAEISGPGISWQANKFQVKIAPGGGLEFDASGNLKTTGGGGGGGDFPPATVAALEAQATEVVGGSLGCGYYLKPQNLMSSYRHGLSMGLDMMNAAVRFLRDGTPVVWFPETTEKINMPIANEGNRDVQEQELHRWETQFSTTPGWKMAYDKGLYGEPDSDDSLAGWFGYFEPGQYGITTLADVLSEIGGKVVLNLHLTFPLLNGQGEFVQPTPAWRTDIFLARVRSMIQAFGLQDSVIVSAYALSIPSGVAPPRINVLDWFASAGIRVGAQFDSSGDVTSIPAANYPANWTWAFFSANLTKEQIQPYVAEGVHSIIYGVSRRYLRDTLVRLPGGAGAKGVLSADPEYYAAQFGDRHRDTVPRLYFQDVKPGLLPPGLDNVSRSNPGSRGSFRLWSASNPLNRLYLDGQEIVDPNNTQVMSKWVSFGPFNPNPSPTSYAIDFGLGYDWNTPMNYRWMMFAFGIATDHSFRDRWEPAGQPMFPPDPVNYPLDSGYALLYDTNGWVFLEAWQQGARTILADAVVNRPVVQNAATFFRIGVNQNGIRLSNVVFTAVPTPGGSSQATTGFYTQGTTIVDVKTDLAKAFRGPYFALGRHKANAAQDNGSGAWWGFIDQPQLVLNGAAPIGPPA